jgi:hypothetical protein
LYNINNKSLFTINSLQHELTYSNFFNTKNIYNIFFSTLNNEVNDQSSISTKKYDKINFINLYTTLHNRVSFNNEKYSLLYKNQYKNLKSGINNLIRLHATGAVAIPSEIRLQILASSKDVIHS